MISLLLWAALLTVEVEKPPPVYQLQELVELHESALGLIHQIELSLQSEFQNYLKEKRFGKLDTPKPWHWARRGEQERLRYDVDSAPGKDGRPTGLYDYFVDETSVRMLRNWDPKNPQKITPLDGGTVSATVMPRTRRAPGLRDVPRHMLWSFSIENDDRRTLAKLVRESPHAELVGPAEIDGHRVWQVRAAHPGVDGVPQPGVSFDVYLDPEVNFAARRVVEHQPDTQKLINGKLEKYSFVVIRTVKEFRDFGGGVFVPVEIELVVRTGSSDGRRIVGLTHVKDLVVNAPLSNDALDFRFPEHALVVGPRVSPTEQRVVLWGPNNRALKEVNSPKDLPGYKEAQEAAAGGSDTEARASRSGGVRRWLLWGNLVVIGCLAVWAGFRRGGRRSARSARPSST